VKPQFAAPSNLPDFVEPVQAKLVDSMLPGNWIYEIKFGGYRALALRGGRDTRVLSRNEKDLASKLPSSRIQSPKIAAFPRFDNACSAANQS